MGLGYDSVVKVPVDSKMKMNLTALESLIASDVAKGNIPVCAVATIGTTDYGSIDNVAEMRKICDKYGIPLLGQIPLVQGVREGGDEGKPAAMKDGPVYKALQEVAFSIVEAE